MHFARRASFAIRNSPFRVRCAGNVAFKMLPQESTMDVNCLKFFKYQYSASLEAAREMGRRTRALGNLLYHAGRAGRVAVAVGGSFVTG